jgi:hypothetical protein
MKTPIRQFFLQLLILPLGFPALAQLPDDVHWFYDYAGGPRPEPFTMERQGRFLYTGGGFLSLESRNEGKNLARFDLETEYWEALPGLSPELNGNVRALHAADDGLLYIGGNFSTAAGVPSSRVIAYDSSSNTFTGLVDEDYTLASTGQENGPTNGDVRGIVKIGNLLYVGGFFSGPPGSPSDEKSIRSFDLETRTWSKLGSGLQGPGGILAQVWDLAALPDGTLLAGGSFAEGLARWDGNTWSAYGGGVGGDGIVRAIEVAEDGTVYIGGSFDEVGAGGNRRTDVLFAASYDPDSDTWDDMAGGFDEMYIQSNGTDFESGGVYDLVLAPNGDLYAGGDFQANPDRSETNLDHVALWDGSGSWKPLGSGVGTTGSQIVNCLGIGLNGDLYVGGTFSEGFRNASSANTQVARWDRNVDFTDYIPGAAENPSLEIISLSESEATLSFRPNPSADYRVQSATDFTDWQPLSGSEFSASESTQITVSRENDTRFYRIEAID